MLFRSMQKGFGPLLFLVCVGNSFGMLFKLYLIIIVGNYSDLLTLFTSYLFVVYFCYVSEDAYCGLKEMIIIARYLSFFIFNHKYLPTYPFKCLNRETKMSGVVCDQLDNVLYSMEQVIFSFLFGNNFYHSTTMDLMTLISLII